MDCRFLLLCFLALVAAQNSSNTTSHPLACINGPRSNCTASWLPRNLTLNVGQLNNLTLPLPCLPILSYSLSWVASNGIGVTVRSLTNTAAILAVQDLAGNGGDFTVFVEWCDASGYGNRSTIVKVITTNVTTLGCINGPRSTCTNNLQPLTETVNVGQIKNVTFTLPCLPVLQYQLTWSATNGTGATVGLLTNTSVSLRVQDVIGNGGTITVYVQWCDATGYGNKSTTVTLVPNRSATATPTVTATATIVPTPIPTAVNTTLVATPTFTATPIRNQSATATPIRNQSATATPTTIVVLNGTATPTSTSTPKSTPTPSTRVSTSGNSPSSGAATLRGWSTGAMGVLLVACVQFL